MIVTHPGCEMRGPAMPVADVISKTRTYSLLRARISAHLSSMLRPQTSWLFKQSRRVPVRLNTCPSPQQPEGLLLVSAAEQDAYVRHAAAPAFLRSLPVWQLDACSTRPGAFRIFEMAGDAMAPGIRPGSFLAGAFVAREQWSSVPDFEIYILLTSKALLIRRILHHSPRNLLLLSDYQEQHPQLQLQLSDVRELWVVRRCFGRDPHTQAEYNIQF